ncbi:MAG: anthranilate phosphoribosyltransferase, partial [Planctomycetes bacterium]|nr:anthranilate phosphoribosyltransferase [Planctomycetota bacterium]
DVPDAQIAAFLTAMKIKTPTSAELAGLAQSLREHAVSVRPKVDNLLDTCGTGGAAVKTFNISTASAFVAAGAGAFVAKHGNRGITSKCGSADVLSALGVKIDAPAEIISRCIEEAHIGFMFAPMFHPAMKFVQPIRKSLGFGTVFNILGPLANPAGADTQVIGVAEESLLEKIAETLKILGLRRAMVVHAAGLDEISTISITKVVELKDGKTNSYEIDPAEFGIAGVKIEQLAGGDARHNAGMVENIIYGRDNGPARDIVLLNAAAAILVAGLGETLQEAFKLAQSSIDDSRAADALKKMIKISNSR